MYNSTKITLHCNLIFFSPYMFCQQLLNCHLQIFLSPYTLCQQLLSCHLQILLSPYTFCQQLLSCHLNFFHRFWSPLIRSVNSSWAFCQQLLSCHLQIHSVNSCWAVTYRFFSPLIHSVNSSWAVTYRYVLSTALELSLTDFISTYTVCQQL